MAAQVAQHLRAVATFLEQVKHTSSFSDVVKKQQEHFTLQMASLTFSVEDANLVMSALKDGPWPTDVAAALLSLVVSKTSQGPSQIGRTQQQNYRWLNIHLDVDCIHRYIIIQMHKSNHIC